MDSSVFEEFRGQAWPYKFSGQLLIGTLVGGTPTDPKVAEGWLRKKLTSDHDGLIQQAVADTMAERGIDVEEAAKIVDEMKHLNGFKRVRCPNCPTADDDPTQQRRCDDGQAEKTHELYIEGRQLKAAKEAASVAVAADKLPSRGWGKTNKGCLNFIAEHVCVLEDRMMLGVTLPSFVNQRFVSTWRGTGIQYEEMVEDVKVDFTIATDYPFTPEQWAMIWLTGEQQGIGATRSQGYGKYVITRWEPISTAPARRRK